MEIVAVAHRQSRRLLVSPECLRVADLHLVPGVQIQDADAYHWVQLVEILPAAERCGCDLHRFAP